MFFFMKRAAILDRYGMASITWLPEIDQSRSRVYY